MEVLVVRVRVRKYESTKVHSYESTFEGTSVQRTRTTNVTCTLRCRSAAVQLDCVHLQGYVTGTCTCSARVVMYESTSVLPEVLPDVRKYFRIIGGILCYLFPVDMRVQNSGFHVTVTNSPYFLVLRLPEIHVLYTYMCISGSNFILDI